MGRHTAVAAVTLLTAAAVLLTGLWRPAYTIVHLMGMSASADFASRTPLDNNRLQSAIHAAQLSVQQGDSEAAHVLHTQARAPGESFLSFTVCGDWATQRVALLSGVALAAELNRTLVLPQLLMGGRNVDFSEAFDVERFIAGTREHGVQGVALLPPGSRRAVHLDLALSHDVVRTLQQHASVQHVSVSCPALHVPADLFVRHEQLVFAAAKALQPQQQLLSRLLRVKQYLQSLSASTLYNVLHLRVEEDWQEQCARWERSNGGAHLDNCMNHTATVGDRLQVHNVENQVPLLLVTGPGSTDPALVQSAIVSLEGKGYRLEVWGDIPGTRGFQTPLTAEAAAMVQHYLALDAHQFVGNSVALPDALLIMERWREGRYATYYNGGNIPLEAHVPLFPLPWVFTYNDWSVGTEYEHMLKAAVTSAIEVGRVKPFCMFTGSKDSEVYQWLAGKGITMIQHTPAWQDALIRESKTGNLTPEEKKPLSHLYKNEGAIVGAYLRIDIPKLPQLDQYNYVLFTDCDVYFRKRMKLIDWGSPLPSAIGMGYERFDLFPYNNGVMLWNMPFMKQTNAEFVEWILNQHNGLHYGKYSAVDQGAFNQFYENEIKDKPLSRKFNSMIYHAFREDALIVHLHGPKPNHYLEWMRTGNCSFGDMCSLGINGEGSGGPGPAGGGLCKYVAEYSRYVPEWTVMQRLNRLCSNLLAGTWHPKS